jgi:tetratricopeptide (TPR) repeat protein
MPRSLYDQISEKAEGNPFYVEEIIRSLIETGQIIRNNGGWRAMEKTAKISLPKTLTGVLSARIDRLSDDTKQVLHFASVIGRSFDVHTLSAISSRANGLDAHIQELVGAGLIRTTDGQELEYTFRHVLIQEAAYNSILLKRRRELHARVGEFLESNYAERLDEYAPILAHHFYSARDTRSLGYDETAGENAMRLYANAEAITHFNRALEVALRIAAPHKQLEGLYIKLGQVLELSGRYDVALETYSQLESYGREHDITSMRLSALMAKATIYSTYTSIHDPALSERALIQALDLSRQIGDRAAQAKLNWNLMLTYLFSKRLDQALSHGELALQSARELDDPEPLAFVLNDLCRLYVCLGRFEEAHIVVKEARELWKILDNQNMLADSYGSEAEAYIQEGNPTKALELINLGLQLSEKIENLWGQAYNRMLMSFIYFDLGEVGRAIQLSEQAIAEGESAGLVTSSTSHRAELGWFYGCYGAIEKGLDLARRALQLADEKQPGFRALPQAVMVRLYLLMGDLESAQELAGNEPLEPIAIPYSRYTTLICLANVELALAYKDYERALALAEDLFIQVSSLKHVDIPDTLRRKGEALVGLNRLEEAHQTLTEACSHAERLGSRHYLWTTLSSLAVVQSMLGKQNEADESRKKAWVIAEEIAESLCEIGLRDSFLGQPWVQALMQR